MPLFKRGDSVVSMGLVNSDPMAQQVGTVCINKMKKLRAERAQGRGILKSEPAKSERLEETVGQPKRKTKGNEEQDPL